MITSQRREDHYTAVATLSLFLFFFSLDRLILIDDHAVLYYVRYQYPDPSHDTASVRNWCDSEHHHQT